jgi:hypothetical protein
MVEGQTEKEENLIVEYFAADQYDITVGDIVTPWNGSGVKTAITTDKGPYFMALMPPERLGLRDLAGATLVYDYSVDGTDNQVPCVVAGYVDCAVGTSTTIPEGFYVEIGTSGGHVGKSDLTNFYEVVGIAMETIATTSTHGLVLLGHYP